MPRRWVRIVAVLVAVLAACAGSQTTREGPQEAVAPREPAIEVPVAPSERLLPRERVASGLLNPRGIHVLPDGVLLVAEAGTGAPGTGRVVRLHDDNADGDLDDAGERSVVLDAQPSKNLVSLVRRDEVFGMAGIAEGGGEVLASLAFFGGPTTIFRVAGTQVAPWTSVHGNINDLSYDPTRHAWYGAASTSDEVVRLQQGRGAERVAKLSPLAQGQDAVPGYIRHDPTTGELLVSLFSGSPEGEEGGEGIELVPRAGAIVGVDPDTRAVRAVVTGLTAPTGIAVGADGVLYVLELCDRFVDPIRTVEEVATTPSHGGFAHHSGRLLRVDRARGAVEVLATGLETPTNLALSGDLLYVTEGMGTPGRPLPNPGGAPVPLDGMIQRIRLR